MNCPRCKKHQGRYPLMVERLGEDDELVELCQTCAVVEAENLLVDGAEAVPAALVWALVDQREERWAALDQAVAYSRVQLGLGLETLHTATSSLRRFAVPSPYREEGGGA